MSGYVSFYFPRTANLDNRFQYKFTLYSVVRFFSIILIYEYDSTSIIWMPTHSVHSCLNPSSIALQVVVHLIISTRLLHLMSSFSDQIYSKLSHYIVPFMLQLDNSEINILRCGTSKIWPFYKLIFNRRECDWKINIYLCILNQTLMSCVYFANLIRDIVLQYWSQKFQ